MVSRTAVRLLAVAGLLVSACAGDGEPPAAPPTATRVATATPTVSPSATATATVPEETPTVGPSPTGPTVTATSTATPTPTPSATDTVSPTATFTPTPNPLFGEIQNEIFNPNCLDSGCHNSSDQGGSMVLEPGVAFEQLVGATPDNPFAARDGLLRVDPGDPANSLLILKLEGPPRTYGSRMPLLEAPLPEDEIDKIRQWIAAGAPR